METLFSCHQAMEQCIACKEFRIAHLYKEEKAMDMHIHDCYEVYYSISGGKQFLIDNKFYTIEPGDLFLINQYESHKLTQIDKMVHERIVLFIHPDYTKQLSTARTDLDACFSSRPKLFQHKLSLNREQQKRFLFYTSKITKTQGFGHDIIEESAFLELMVFFNTLVNAEANIEEPGKAAIEHSAGQLSYVNHSQVDMILSYINDHITAPISIAQLSSQFFLSESYICRIFKAATGTTVNKYVNARRISIAKASLSDGATVMEAYEKSGFTDYSNFFKAFSRAVGISPKKYAQCAVN